MQWSTHDIQTVLLIFRRIVEDYKIEKECPYCYTHNKNLIDGHASGCLFRDWLINNSIELTNNAKT
jgi:hypothetical protein